MNPESSHDAADVPTPAGSGGLVQQLESAHAELRRLREENANLTRHIHVLERVGADARGSRLASSDVFSEPVEFRGRAEDHGLAPRRDVDGRFPASSDSREGENRLHALADSVPQIIWANDVDGVATYFNRRWFEYSGFSSVESAGAGWLALVHPEDAPVSQRTWQEALGSGKAFDGECRLRRADGAYHWFMIRAEPLRNESGNITGWLGSATEIQALKEAQAVMRDREAQLRRAIEEAPIPMIMHAEDGEVLQISRTWTKLTGYTPQDMASFDAWMKKTCGEGADVVRERLHEAFSQGRTCGPEEFDIVTRSGEHRHWLFRASSPGVLSDGRRYAVGMAVDLTERDQAQAALQASQERLHLIVESALEHAIIAMDLDRRVTSWNSGAEHLLGHGREEMIHQLADVIFTAEDLAAGAPVREAEAALEHGRAADERWHVRKDGTRFWGSGVMLPIFEQPGGTPTGLLKILRDETSRREAEQALEASRQHLLLALRAKDDFLAMLSHELRTPLNPVLLIASEGAEDPALPAHVRADFAAIRTHVQLEARLIGDLIDLTGVARGRLQLEYGPSDAHAVLEAAVGMVRQQAREKSIAVRLDLEAAHHQLHGDPARLQQIFWNVLNNALKFTPTGGRITVGTRNTPANDRLITEITDTGIGMTEAELERVFDAFTQGERGLPGGPSIVGGLGLGLSISKILVEAHGGSIRAVSAGRSRGTTIEVDLPLPRAGGEGERKLATACPGRGASTVDHLRRERILLVEDHGPTRQALAAMLRRRGLFVELAATAQEAREIARREEITLLLSDIGLPDGDGYALMEELKRYPGLRGIALTGYGTDADRERSRRAGFLAHLTKPISAQALDRVLADVAS